MSLITPIVVDQFGNPVVYDTADPDGPDSTVIGRKNADPNSADYGRPDGIYTLMVFNNSQGEGQGPRRFSLRPLARGAGATMLESFLVAAGDEVAVVLDPAALGFAPSWEYDIADGVEVAVLRNHISV